MLYYMDKETERYPEQLMQSDGVTEDVSKHATLDPKKVDTTNSELMPGVGKRLKQIAREEGPSGDSSFLLQSCPQWGKPCPICGSSIEPVPIHNRGSHFCPGCQPFDSGPLI